MQNNKQLLLKIIDEMIQRGHNYTLHHLKQIKTERLNDSEMNIQPWSRLNIVLRGSMDYETSTGSLHLTENEIAIISPFYYCRIAAFDSKPCPPIFLSLVMRNGYLRMVYNECIAGRSIWPPTLQYHLNTLSLATINLFNAFAALEAIKVPDGVAQEMFLAMLKLIRHDLEHEEGEGQHSKSYYLFLAAVDYLEQNYNRQISRLTIAKELHLSISYLSRLFHQYAGVTFYQYQMRIRMQEAAKLLKKENLTIGEIGWQCGFQTTSFFIRKFKEYYFMTPAQYRLQANFENANPTE